MSCTDCMDMYTAGYLAGTTAAEHSQEEHAELAAAKFYAMEHYQTWLDDFIPATVSAMEVEAYRRSPGTSYIPRDGDPRYAQGTETIRTLGGGH